MLRLFAASVVLLVGLIGYAKGTAVGFDDAGEQYADGPAIRDAD